MPETEAAKIARLADMIVGGYAMLKHALGVRIVNLHSGSALVVSPEYQVLETSMDDLEVALAINHLKTNKTFLEA